MSKGVFDYEIAGVFWGLTQEAERLRTKRINSTMLLRALLSAEISPLYDALSQQFKDEECIPFSDIIDETYMYDPPPKDPDSESEEEPYDGKITLVFDLGKGEENLEVCFDKDLEIVLKSIIEHFEKGEMVTIKDVTAFFLEYITVDVIKVLRTYSVDVNLLKSTFWELNNDSSEESSDSKKVVFEVPKEFKSFVKNLNEIYKGTTCDISGRDKECKFIWQTMQKHTKKNVVLIGEPGVGKTSVVKKITHDIISGNCPEEFKNSTVLSVDVTSSVAGTQYRGQAEERYSAFADFLEKQPNIIVFIDEIHLIRGAGACKEGEVDLANALKPILAGSDVTIIGATTREEYEKYFSKDGAIKRRFRPIKVKEPKMNEVYPMLEKSIQTLSKYHGVTISKEMVDFVILNAACFDNETCNPDRTKDLIDLSMVVAKQAGKTKVDRESVLENFEYHFEKFSKMSEYSKLSTAYHEAGHCLVATFAESLKDHDVIAVSIMPTDTYLGVTVYEDNENTVEPTMSYFIDSIARSLAGRVAEKMFTDTITSGASADLVNATKTAHDIVTRYGMVEFGMNRIYTEETNNEESIKQINKWIDKLIDKAMKRAEEILKENETALKRLVDALMKKGIVGPKELEKILNVKQK